MTPDEVLAASVDELAMRVLDDARANDEWNYRNWLLRAQTEARYPKDVVLALSAAWGWLQSHGLIALDVGQSAAEAFRITRHGHEALVRGLEYLRATQRLDVPLHPILETKVRPQFLRGDLEAAVFMAMKEVEVAVRRASSASDSLVGVKLMQEAFKPTGRLARLDADAGEVVAEMNLFMGAIGLFKNPSSHRPVDYSDSTAACEIVLLADLLLRLLEGRG